MREIDRLRSELFTFLVPAFCAGLGLGCSAQDPSEPLASTNQAVTNEDGLADAYAFFKNLFTLVGLDTTYRIAAGFHPALSTETVSSNGLTASAKVILSIDPPSGRISRIQATLDSIPMSQDFDLWLVKNGPSGTVKPETGDSFYKVGTFTIVNSTNNDKSLDVSPQGGVVFDLDMVVVTRKDQHPTVSRIATGERTLLEKRFFREAAGQPMDPVAEPRADFVETNDPLVQRGAQLFFSDTFGGNGRTCGTCHRLNNNLTIDAAFISTLPSNDPLFVSETNPALAQLEDARVLRSRALILENTDGFGDPTHKFTDRSPNHTFALGTTLDFINQAFFGYPSSPPRQRLGWGGDGAPGAGSLHEFAFGAIVQHMTKRLDRVPGTDFRIPTQGDLDALEAFQLFTGRQHSPDITLLGFRDATAQRGQALATSQSTGGKCASCHFELQANTPNLNENFDIGTDERVTDLPADDGFRQPLQSPITQFIPSTGVPGAKLFNVAPVIEAADTAPFFHNNSAATIEDTVQHYTSPFFANSPGSALVGGIQLSDAQVQDIANFLRELNALENIRQVRKRMQFVHDNRSTGNTTILSIAQRDAQDAIGDLSAKSLNLAAQNDLANVRQTLVIAAAQPDVNRPAYLDNGLVYLDLAENEILTSNPNGEFIVR
jgi:cytochrome c peroxidase